MKKVNFHTHTWRCGHASGDEEAMIKAAIDNKVEVLGMCCHVPLPKYQLHLLRAIPSVRSVHALGSLVKSMFTGGPSMRMPYKQRDEHLKIVDELKEKYKDEIKIYKGFEAEYFEDYLDYYRQMLQDGVVDYIILGHHFDKYAIHNRYYGKKELKKKALYRYCNDIEKAIETGLFSYIAHPDLFMIGYKNFDEDAKVVTQRICKKALEYDIPLELNAGGIRRGLEERNGQSVYPYANENFFQIAGETGNKVIIGIDAHSPEDFNDGIYQQLNDLAQRLNLNLVDSFEMKKGLKKDNSQ